MPGMQQMLRIQFCAIAAVLAAASTLRAQETPVFEPFPAGSAASYHFDLARNFFASPTIEADSRADLLRRLERLRTTAPAATHSATALLQALRLQDSVQRETGKHLAYWSLRSLINTSDTLAQRVLNEFSAAATPGYEAVDLAIAASSRNSIDSLLRNRPELERYSFYIDQVYRAARRQPPPETAGAINALTPQVVNWGPALFRTTMAAIDFGTVMTPEGPLDLRRQGNAIRSHPSRAVREEGYKRNLQGLTIHRSTFAFILTQSAEGRNALARLRGFPDYPEESYAE